MDFLLQLLDWALAHPDELKWILGIFAALVAIIAALYNGWNWVRGRGTGGAVRKVVKTTEEIGKLAYDYAELRIIVIGLNRYALSARGAIQSLRLTPVSRIPEEARLRDHGGAACSVFPHRKGASHDHASATDD